MTANRRVSCVAGLWLASSCAAQVVLPDADGDGHPIFGTISVRPDFEFDGDHEPRGGKATCIAFGDLDGDGDLDAVCTLNDTQNVSYITVMFNSGDGVLGPPTAYLAGSGSCAVDLADVDRDGDVDAAIANFKDDTISVLRNDGAGVLGGLVKYRVGSDPRSLKLADVNGDGAPDVISLNVGSRDVSVLLNDGVGGYLWPGARLAVAGVSGHNGHSGPHLDVADLNSDGAIDIAVPAGSSITLLINQGDGSFELAAAHPRLAAPSAYHVLARDLDGDADADLACAVSEGSGGDHALQVFKNDGNAGFGPPDAYSIDPWDCAGCWFDTTSVAGGDFDGDGDSDLIVTQNSFEFTTIYNNAGDGTFTRETRTHSRGAWHATVADVTGDGTDDPVLVHGGTGRSVIRVLIDGQSGDALHADGLFPYQLCVAVGDFDSDGDADAVLGTIYDRSAVRVLRNDRARQFSALDPIELGPSGVSEPESIEVADLNHDDILDLVVCDVGAPGGWELEGSLWVLLGRGDGTFLEPVRHRIEGMLPWRAAAADIDLDGNVDVLAWQTEVSPGEFETPVRKGVAVWRGDGTGAIAPSSFTQIGNGSFATYGGLAICDFNGDGAPDVIASWRERWDPPTRVCTLLNDGAGGLSLSACVESSWGVSDLECRRVHDATYCIA